MSHKLEGLYLPPASLKEYETSYKSRYEESETFINSMMPVGRMV